MSKKYSMPQFDHGVARLFDARGYVRSETGPDFIVYTGGADVTPELYGQGIEARTYTDPERDYYDMLAYIKYGHLPKVGICRGFQFLAAATGYQLKQHIDGHGNRHLCTYKSSEFFVSSTHHQCVVHPDPLFVSSDGVCEGAWLNDTAFGVQFHPEYTSCSIEAEEAFFTEVKKLLGEEG